MATSAVTSPPGVSPVTEAGSGVPTPGRDLTVTRVRASVTSPGPALTSRTRMIWRGRAASRRTGQWSQRR